MTLRTAAIPATGEDDRDKPSGAGVAPERQEEEPRAGARRGKGGSGKQAFFRYLSRTLFSDVRSALPAVRRAFENGATETLQAFGAQARWMCSSDIATAATELGVSPGAGTNDDDGELGRILSAIADDVGRISSAACASVMAEFAGRMVYARAFLPRSQIQGALQAIREARAAALAAIKRNAVAELAARRDVAIGTYVGRVKGNRGGLPSALGKPQDGPKPH